MQAVVKTPRIELKIRGEIPSRLISVLEKEFGKDLRLREDQDEELLDVFDTDWYEETKAGMTPGNNLKIYRENRGWSQTQLGEKLGSIPRQHVSNMERGTRPISKKTARRLAEIFRVSPAKFI